jgi:hypothetical protein
MKFAEFKNIVVIIIVLGIFGVAFWVSRLPYQENEPNPAPVSMSTATLPKPIFVVINNPTNGFVGVPSIQLNGHFVGDISNITYDVINSIDCRTNQRNYFISWGSGSAEVATNYFECRDLSLSKGTNLIILHTSFADGRTLTNQVTCVLDYSRFTNPPDLKIIWPANGTSIGGTTFDLQAQVADPSTTIHVSVSSQSSSQLEFDDAMVMRNGRVIVKNLPLENGTNVISVVAKDAAGNSSTTNLNICESPVTISMRPINPEKLNQQFASVSGMISDPSLTVWVNSQQATVSPNGQWQADRVVFAHTGIVHIFKSEIPRFGYRPNVTFYFTVSAFKGKAMIVTQQFEASP